MTAAERATFKAGLAEKRRAKLAEGRAILDKVKTEKRGLNAEETRNYNILFAEVEDLGSQISSMAPETQAVSSADADDRRFAEGRAIGLRSKDRLTEFVQQRSRQAQPREPVSFGQLARSYITGRVDNLNDAERRALAESTISGGGIMAPEAVSAEVIDLARAKSRVIEAGALTVPMTTGSLTLAKMNEGITPEWKEENLDGAESDAAFGGVVLLGRTLHVHCYVSLELIEDAPNAAEVVEREFTAAMASEFDRVALMGTGLVHEPLGLLNKAGVNVRTLGAGNGLAPADYDFLIDALGDVWTAHGDPTAILYSSRTAVSLAKLKEAVNLQPLRIPDTVAAVPRLVTNQIPNTLTTGSSTDCSVAFTGDFRMLAIGVRVGFQFEASRTAGDAFKRGQVMVRGRLRGDIGILRANHFTRTLGIRT